ncbi:PEP-CTERM sorting domain-containing protein [Pontiellaceae bacterium B12227]|nr:PEP-CTERM sorting domain-containing protein [Pontiellaceae bacterium B12227]
MKKLAILTTVAVVALSAQANVVLYSNDGSSELNFGAGTVTTGTIGGRTGDFIAVDNDYTSGGGFINVNTGNIDFSGYDGQNYTVSYDIYSHADIDDNVYNSVDDILMFDESGAATGAGKNYYNLDGQASWTTYTRTGTVDLSAGADALANILFVSNTQSTSGEAGTPPRYYLDNISVTVIPEPATLGLIGAFGGGILFIRRRFMM